MACWKFLSLYKLQQCKNFSNRLRFDKVIAKVRDHSFFGGHSVYPGVAKIDLVFF